MRIAYFDCFSGAAGDMLLGAMIDSGIGVEFFQDVVRSLNLPGVELFAEKVKRKGIAGTHVQVAVAPGSQKKHRHLPEILRIIDGAGLSERATRNAKAVFQRLAEAEAQVHATTIEKVHFHEVGAADAIVDIVGACVGLERLNIDRVICSPIPTGNGTLQCEHGTLPVPAPATALLLRGVPLAACDEQGELTTPTGAAVLTTLASEYGPLPSMSIRAIGHGAGTREGANRPNLLRLILGDSRVEADDECDTVVVLEAQVDDSTGQAIGYALERMLAEGALDVYAAPILMKKGRPGHWLTALARPADVDAVERIFFSETSTLGVRRHECRRNKLPRRHEVVRTRLGDIRVKIGERSGVALQAWPEYDDCLRVAQASGAPLREVQAEALRVWTQQRENASN